MSTTEEKTNNAPAEEKRFETAIAGDVTTSYEDGDAATKDSEGNSIDLEDGDSEEPGSESDAKDDAGDKGDDDEESDAPDPDALPDFDPEKPEVLEQYDARYFKDGKLSEEALGAEYWKSFKANGEDIEKAGLNEGTYKYLEKVLGVPKPMIKQLERGMVADRVGREADWINKMGGPQRVTSALEWARNGGYTEDMRKRFNAAYDKGGADRDDAMDALLSRFDRAKPSDRRGPPPPRRGSKPDRDVTGGGASGGGRSGDTYGNRKEHKADLDAAFAERRAAKESGDREALRKANEKIDAVRAKGQRSNFR